MMTLRELIEELQAIEREEGPGIEVVATSAETGETFTPVIAVGPDDGVRRVFI
jgi:hypothetical protein